MASWKAPNKGKTNLATDATSSRFPTVGKGAAQSAGTRKPDVPRGGGLRSKHSPTGALDNATATHRNNIKERLGAKLHPTATLYKSNAASAGDTQRNTRIVPSAIGNRDFWAKREYGA